MFDARQQKTMIWIQPLKRRRLYELRVGDDIVAKLFFTHKYRRDAVVRLPPSEWSFRFSALPRPTIHVCSSNSGSEIAVYTGKWYGGGTFSFRDGRRYTLKSENVLPTEWVWTDRVEQPLLYSTRNIQTMSTLGAHLPTTDVAMLGCISWYLHVLMTQFVRDLATYTATQMVFNSL